MKGYGRSQSRGKNIPYNQNQDQDQEDQLGSQLDDYHPNLAPSSSSTTLNLAQPAPDRKVAIVAISEGKAYLLGDLEAKLGAAQTLSADITFCIQSEPVDEAVVSRTLKSIYDALKGNPAIKKLSRPDIIGNSRTSMATFNYDKLAFALVYGQGSIYQDELDFIGGHTQSKPNESFLYGLREPFEKHFAALKDAKEMASRHGSLIEAPANASITQNMLFIYMAIGIFVICASVAGVVYLMRRPRRSEPVEANIEVGDKKF